MRKSTIRFMQIGQNGRADSRGGQEGQTGKENEVEDCKSRQRMKPKAGGMQQGRIHGTR